MVLLLGFAIYLLYKSYQFTATASYYENENINEFNGKHTKTFSESTHASRSVAFVRQPLATIGEWVKDETHVFDTLFNKFRPGHAWYSYLKPFINK